MTKEGGRAATYAHGDGEKDETVILDVIDAQILDESDIARILAFRSARDDSLNLSSASRC